MKTLVERIRKRELAIENNGSLEELRKVLKYCFPKDCVTPSGIGKYFASVKNYKDTWLTSDSTYLEFVSVKEVLAEIEGEGKQTKVIYLNEEDRPKIEEPLSLVDWFDKYSQEDAGWHHQNYYTQNEYAEKWLEYRNNFKPNDKPIEFTHKLNFNTFDWKEAGEKPNEFEKIEYRGNGCFWASMNHNFYPYVFKGNLNNGKLK